MGSKDTERKAGKLSDSLERLSIKQDASKLSKQSSNSTTVAPVSQAPSRPTTPLSDLAATPEVPPPTPMSPTHRHGGSMDWPSHQNMLRGGLSLSAEPSPRSGTRGSTAENTDQRPEKSNAAARRMIAGALGVKTPKMTEEQKQYEKAVRGKEQRRKDKDRDDAHQREREAEEAKRAIWDD